MFIKWSNLYNILQNLVWEKDTSLISKNDNLFEYACMYEDELEKDKLLRHENAVICFIIL